jgi:hypothetical protein
MVPARGKDGCHHLLGLGPREHQSDGQGGHAEAATRARRVLGEEFGTGGQQHRRDRQQHEADHP